MGRGQVVRRLSLEQEIVGSNPTAPARINSNFSQRCSYAVFKYDCYVQL